MTEHKRIKQHKRIKDYKRKKNIINSWKDHIVSLIKKGATKITNPRVQFPKRKIIKKK